MASVVIQGDTSGSVTLQAPAVAGSTTVNLPSTIGNAGTSAVVTTDASGDVGIGVTPSAWASPFKVMEGGDGSTYQSSLAFQTNNDTVSLNSNVYYNGSNYIYKYSKQSSRFVVNKNEFQWFLAPSGTAGNAISFTQAMTLDASGNLMLGTTSTDAKLNVYGGGIRLSNSTVGSTGGLVINQNASDAVISNQANGYLLFGSNNTERARITSAGEFYIAGTTDQGAYNLQVNGTGVWGAGAYVNGSDARIKDDIKPLPSSLSVVQNLNPVTFRYKESWSKDTSVQPGFIAQELQQALAGQEYIDGVVMQGPEYMSVAYQTLIPVLTKAIQEQQTLIEQLTTRIAALEAK